MLSAYLLLSSNRSRLLSLVARDGDAKKQNTPPKKNQRRRRRGKRRYINKYRERSEQKRRDRVARIEFQK